MVARHPHKAKKNSVKSSLGDDAGPKSNTVLGQVEHNIKEAVSEDFDTSSMKLPKYVLPGSNGDEKIGEAP